MKRVILIKNLEKKDLRLNLAHLYHSKLPTPKIPLLCRLFGHRWLHVEGIEYKCKRKNCKVHKLDMGYGSYGFLFPWRDYRS